MSLADLNKMKTEELVKKLAQLKKDETRLTWNAMPTFDQAGLRPFGGLVEDAYIEVLGEIGMIERELVRRQKA